MEKLTLQKRTILDFMQKTRSHPDSEEVYENMRKKIPMISRATVYRNLNQLADKGVIARIEGKNRTRFDGVIDGHQHLICERCGSITDLELKDVDKIKSALDLNKGNFKINNVEVIAKGVCEKCAIKIQKLKGGKKK